MSASGARTDAVLPDRLWRLVEDHSVTVLGMAPTAIRSLMGDLKGITKAEIVAAANLYLTKSRQVEIRVLPASAADSTESGAKRAKQPVREATAQ